MSHIRSRIEGGWARIDQSLLAQGALIFLVTALVRIATMIGTGLHRELFVAELQKTAQSLAFGGVFGNPYLIPTGPSAHAAPVYTVLVAGIYYLFGGDLHGQLILFLFNIALTGLQFALIPLAAQAMGLNRRVGLLAGLLAALFPIHYKVEIRAGDAPVFGAMLLVLCILTLREWRKDGWTLSRAVVFGVAWGFGGLANAALLPVFVTVIAVTVVRKSGGRGRTGRLSVAGQAVASLLALCAVLAPWTVRNSLALGGFVIGRSNLGIEMRLAYNDLAQPDMLSNFSSGSTRLYHPLVSRAAAQAVLQEGEVAYNHRLLRDALRWISDHPSRAGRLTLTRLVYFWFPKTPELSRILIFSVLSLLAFAGLFLLRSRAPDTVRLVLAVWVSYPLIFYLLVSSPRYRYPLTWMLVLLAVHAVDCGLWSADCGMKNEEKESHR